MWSQIMSVSFVTTYFEQHFEIMIIGEFSKMSKSSWWRQFTAISWRMCYWIENNVNPRNCASCQTVFIRKYLLNFIYVYLYKSVFFLIQPHIRNGHLPIVNTGWTKVSLVEWRVYSEVLLTLRKTRWPIVTMDFVNHSLDIHTSVNSCQNHYRLCLNTNLLPKAGPD